MQLPVPTIWVASVEGLDELVRHIEDLAPPHGMLVLGVDTEWGSADSKGPSVVQLATAETAWVVDSLPTADVEYIITLRRSLSAIFMHPQIVTVGWSFRHDLERLEALLRQGPTFSKLVDLQPVAVRHDQLRELPSLSRCCQSLLGYCLDKEQQCSDWDRRPLNQNQLKYAALDAYVLTLLHAKLLESPGQHPRAPMNNGS